MAMYINQNQKDPCMGDWRGLPVEKKILMQLSATQPKKHHRAQFVVPIKPESQMQNAVFQM